MPSAKPECYARVTSGVRPSAGRDPTKSVAHPPPGGALAAGTKHTIRFDRKTTALTEKRPLALARQFVPHLFEQLLGGLDPFRLAQLLALVLDAHIAVIAGVEHDLHHL